MSDDLAIAPAAEPPSPAAPEDRAFTDLAEAIAELPQPEKRRRGKAGQLSRDEVAIIIRAIQNNWPTKRIAAVLDVGHDTISHWRNRIRDTTQLGKQVLKGGVLDAALQWRKASKIAAQRGDHRPAKELMQAAGAIDQDIHTGVQVNIGMGAGAMGSDPIDVSVSNNGSSVK